MRPKRSKAAPIVAAERAPRPGEVAAPTAAPKKKRTRAVYVLGVSPARLPSVARTAPGEAAEVAGTSNDMNGEVERFWEKHPHLRDVRVEPLPPEVAALLAEHPTWSIEDAERALAAPPPPSERAS